MTETTITTALPRVSYSSLVSHRGCPQRWAYANIEHLTEKESEEAKVELEFGNWWHALRAADSLARGRKLHSLKQVPRRIRTVDGGPEFDNVDLLTPEDVLAAAKTWADGLSYIAREAWANRIGGQLPERLEYVNDRWRERWEADLPYEQPLAVELWWERDLPITGLKQPMGGFIDEVIYDTRRGMVVIRDHKSHKALAPTTAQDDLMDSQLQIYAWGGTPIIAEWGKGPIRALSYDRVRMAAPKEPKLNLSGTLSKQITDFDLHTYETWVEEGQRYPGLKKDGSGAGVYTADQRVIDHLRSEATRSAWFQRTMVPVNRNVVKTHLGSAVDTALETQRTRARWESDGFTARNFTAACRWCPFVHLCRAQLVGGPAGDYDLDAMGLRKAER